MTENVLSQPFIRDGFLSKLLRSKIFWLIFCLFFFSYPLFRSINRELPPEKPILSVLPDYQLTDENGASYGSKDLKGRFYIANFHFTNCPTICAELMSTMQSVQKRVKGMGQKVALVSFTVDPENDTPKVLFKKARDLKANPYVWKFLTGDINLISKLLIDGFKVPMGDKDTSDIDVYDIAHSGRFVLVDNLGQIRGYYSTDTDSINKLMIDLGLLANRPLTQGADNV